MVVSTYFGDIRINWDQMDLDDRIHSLNAFANDQLQEEGLEPDEVYGGIYYADPSSIHPDDTDEAWFNVDTRDILIDPDALMQMTADAAIELTLHELEHAIWFMEGHSLDSQLQPDFHQLIYDRAAQWFFNITGDESPRTKALKSGGRDKGAGAGS